MLRFFLVRSCVHRWGPSYFKASFGVGLANVFSIRGRAMNVEISPSTARWTCLLHKFTYLSGLTQKHFDNGFRGKRVTTSAPWRIVFISVLELLTSKAFRYSGLEDSNFHLFPDFPFSMARLAAVAHPQIRGAGDYHWAFFLCAVVASLCYPQQPGKAQLDGCVNYWMGMKCGGPMHYRCIDGGWGF